MDKTFYNYNKNKELTVEEENEYQITNERLKNAIILNSSLGSKLKLNDYKKDKEYLTRRSTSFPSSFGSFITKRKVIKTYYDTEDMFFHAVGINICETIEKGNKEKEITVRYDSSIERISYLKFLPDTYILKVKAKDRLSLHFEFIESAILQLITNGLQQNVMELLKKLKPLVVVNKDSERWKYTLPNKLEVVCNYDNCIFTSPKTRDKFKANILEIMASNKPDDFAETYKQFIKDLILDLPTLIEESHSDLFIGLNYLLDIRK